MKIKDIQGQVFGRLTVIQQAGRDKHRRLLWECRCSCGRNVAVLSQSLRQGRTRSCGCLKKEVDARRCIVHGHARRGKQSSIYHAWANMLDRTTNPNCPVFKYYGGAGVKVCRRWRTFANFYHDMGKKPAGAVLGRKGDVGNYEPRNVEWQTHSADLRTRYAKRALLRRRS